MIILLDFILKNRLQLIPFLWVVGSLIKNSNCISDKYIPLILGALGVTMSILMGGDVVDNIIQGILVTGAAVYGNELIKQSGKGD